MLAHRYQIWPGGWGEDKDPDGDIEKRPVGVTAIAKRDRHSPNEVFNELVAMRLGQLMGLPVPVGLTLERDGNVYFASCHVLAAGGELPAADLARFAKDKPEEACGVTVFDAWIANGDRHDQNLWYDYYAKTYVLFDHGRAILGGAGKIHMTSSETRLGIRLDAPCIAQHIRSFDSIEKWIGLIDQIPESAIRMATREASAVGVDESLAVECANWLVNRRKGLLSLFRSAAPNFPKRDNVMFGPFGVVDGE